MESSFWHEKWEAGHTAFHEGKPNDLFVQHFSKLNLEKGSRIFLPLCGKTVDIAWLLYEGYQVVGAELSELAINALFEELEFSPSVTESEKLRKFEAENLTILVGDIFDISADILGPVSATYDRAALVALPEEMRHDYTTHLHQITRSAQQLLITFEYDQSRLPGPPFSVTEEEVNQHYADHYQISRLHTREVIGGLKGKVSATESIFILEEYRR